MWKKVLVVGATAAAILGAGTAALAVTGSAGPTPSPSTAPATPHHAKATARRERRRGLRHAEHATITVKDAKAPGFLTHDAVRGTVTAVSPSSITVRSADGTVESYLVTATTVVHTKADGKAKGETGQIGAVSDGDTVRVLGTGTTTLTATHVLDATH